METNKKKPEEAEVRFDRSKPSFEFVKRCIEGYNGEKLSAKEFNALSQAKKITALKCMGDKVFAGCGQIRCLDKRHEDTNPSMGYAKEQHGFYCLGCQRSCDLIDLVGAVDGRIKFSEAYKKCVKLFVEAGGDTLYKHKPKYNGVGKCRKTSTYKKDVTVKPQSQEVKGEFLPKPMWKALHNKYYFPLESLDKKVCNIGLATLLDRGLVGGDVGDEMDIAKKFHLCGWEYKGAYYLVFVNDDGSACRRYLGGAYSDRRWWNTKGRLGIFNERAFDSGDIVFVCEGCFDALTVMCFSPYKAVSLNGLANLERVLNRKNIKPILLMDSDGAGRDAVLKMQESTGFYVPAFLQEGYSRDSYIAQYKDISEAASIRYKKLGKEITKEPDFNRLRAELKALYEAAKKYYKEQELKR